jgi:hypothetical protein
VLMIAMAGAKKQRKKAKLEGVITPKKPTKPERFVIGSSSTWKDEQLNRHKVIQGGASDPKIFIPEKWFDFGDLERYQSRTTLNTPAKC